MDDIVINVTVSDGTARVGDDYTGNNFKRDAPV